MNSFGFGELTGKVSIMDVRGMSIVDFKLSFSFLKVRREVDVRTSQRRRHFFRYFEHFSTQPDFITCVSIYSQGYNGKWLGTGDGGLVIFYVLGC